MAAEIYRITGDDVITIKDGSRSAIPMRNNVPIQLGGTYTSGELFRNGTNLFRAVNTSNAYGITGWNTGATTEPNFSLWHNYNNQADRLYLAVSSVKYSFVPGRYKIYTFYNKSMTDPNGYGDTAHELNFRFGSGGSTDTNRYLNLPTTSRYLINSMSFVMKSVVDTSGTDAFACNWQFYNTAGTLTASGNIFNGGRPTLNQRYSVSWSPTATQTGNNFTGQNNTNRVRFEMSLNNFNPVMDFEVEYTSVPISTYSLTRLVY
jgi:hypothetical protein